MLCARAGPRLGAVVGHSVGGYSGALRPSTLCSGCEGWACGCAALAHRAIAACMLQPCAVLQLQQHVTQGWVGETDLPRDRAHGVVVEQRAVREHERVQFAAGARV